MSLCHRWAKKKNITHTNTNNKNKSELSISNDNHILKATKTSESVTSEVVELNVKNLCRHHREREKNTTTGKIYHLDVGFSILIQNVFNVHRLFGDVLCGTHNDTICFFFFIGLKRGSKRTRNRIMWFND